MMSYFLVGSLCSDKMVFDCTFCMGVPSKHLLLYYFMGDVFFTFYCVTAFSCSTR